MSLPAISTMVSSEAGIQDKKEIRDKLARDTEEFLANGGEIKVYPYGATGILEQMMRDVVERMFPQAANKRKKK